MKNKINRMVVVNINIPRYSQQNQEYYQEIELLDPDDNYRWYRTFVSEENANYAQWKKILERDDAKQNCYVIEGTFRRKNIEKKLVNADAGFVISETADRELILNLIAEQLTV